MTGIFSKNLFPWREEAQQTLNFYESEHGCFEEVGIHDKNNVISSIMNKIVNKHFFVKKNMHT
jgi:hypothetical protein